MKHIYAGLAIAGLFLTIGCVKKDSGAAGGDSKSGAAAGTEAAKRERTLVQEAGFSTPESMLHDTAADEYLVSNIQGSPLEKDGNGFISRLGTDGKVKKLRWIDGAADGVELNAPKGMAITGEKLFVSDIDVVRVFDRTSGKPLKTIEVTGAIFLNDVVAAEDGTVYVSDTGVKAGAKGFEPVTGKAAIHQIAPDGVVTTLIRNEELMGPNGLAIDGKTLWVVTFNGNKLIRIEKGQIAATTELPAAGLDGLVRRPDGTLYVSSWPESAVFSGKPDAMTKIEGDLTSPADIAFDAKRNRVLVPLFQKNHVVFLPVPAKETASAGGSASTH